MSLTTRCPNCATLFKVTSDQLRISSGWVRCGHCANVFDAQAHLHVQDSPASKVSSISVSENPGAQTLHVQQAQLEHEQVSSQGAAQQTATKDITAPQAAPRPEEVLEPTTAQSVQPLTTDAPTSTAQAQVNAADADVEVGFVRQARRQAFWQSGPVRFVMVALALMLLLGLALQVLVHERDRLAAAQPQWQSVLDPWCERLGCKVAPLRRIDAITVDSSAFDRVLDNDYRLSVALRNSSDLVLAAPALELTLTDVRQQVLVRRVLTAQDLGWVTSVLAPQQVSAGSAVLRLQTSAGDQALDPAQITGYRVLVFYP